MADKTGLQSFGKPPFASSIVPPTPRVDPTTLQASHNPLPPSPDNATQKVHRAATSTPLDALESLPTIAGAQDSIYLANDDIKKFLAWDLDLSRLNRIHAHLWMAGRPMRSRPLHRYKMMGFDILHTQQADLHLLKFSNKLMLKPVGEYMLDYTFWTEHICTQEGKDGENQKEEGDDEEEERVRLWKSAAGFLLSYIWLVTTPLDLRMAHDLFLLPQYITWTRWKDFVKDFVAHVDPNALDQVNMRYHYGDLRLGRINSIYRTRFAHTHFIRGYLYGYNRYVVFFQRKFGWILIVFVFFSLVLAAMQVGASVQPLDDDIDYLRSCYGFVVASMVSVAAVLGVVAIVFVFTFLFNMGAAIQHSRKMHRVRKKKAGEKRGKKDV